MPLKEFLVCRIFPLPFFLFFAFREACFISYTMEGLVPNIMASMGVKMEFFWKKNWIQLELNHNQEPHTI